MDLVPTLISSGWASGVNAYLTVALLSLLGRAGWGEVPESLQSNGVLIAALALFAIEFVADKVPYVDNLWDAVHTAVRPAIASTLGVVFAGDAGSTGLEEALSGGGSGAMALASHAVKAGLRLGVNTSPEPFSNILVSLTEDGVVAGVVLLALEHPVEAAVISVVLLIAGIALVTYLATRIRRALRGLRERRGRPPPAPG
ncbi:MAG: DUF4126 domain-containing protein [Thermoleophilaceae bacterium]|nr:DUF4126 domain-containing protein [Thermoleophilaceae bacterium]